VNLSLVDDPQLGGPAAVAKPVVIQELAHLTSPCSCLCEMIGRSSEVCKMHFPIRVGLS
jgi:hypothetical protein